MKEHLSFLGLDEKTSKLYLKGLEVGPQPASTLAELLNLKRPTTYVILERLSALGLVEQSIIGRRTYFTMKHPLEVKKLLYQQKDHARRLLQSLPTQSKKMTIAHVTPHKTKIRVFRGQESFWKVVEEILKSESNIVWLGKLETLFRFIPEHEVFKQFSARRMRKNLTTRAITDRSIKHFPRFAEHVSFYRSYKFLDDLDTPLIVATWQDSIAILNPEDEFSLAIIEDKQLVKLFRTIFDLLWNKL